MMCFMDQEWRDLVQDNLTNANIAKKIPTQVHRPEQSHSINSCNGVEEHRPD